MLYLTTMFYIIGGILCTLASLFMFGSYFKVKHTANLSLAFVFFWIGLHAFAFALPTIIDKFDLSLLALGYIIGIGMIFLTLLSTIETMAFMARNVISKTMINFVSTVVTVIAIITLSIMIYDFRTPIINPVGIIFWNINPIAAWLVGIVSFGFGLIWGHVFYQAALLVNEAYLRVRLLVMSADGFILGTIVILVHTSSNEVQTILGHALFIIVGVITLGIYLLPKQIFEFRQN